MQALRCYGNEWIVEIKDITDFVREQHKHVKSNQLDKLIVVRDRVYPVAAQIGVIHYSVHSLLLNLYPSVHGFLFLSGLVVQNLSHITERGK